MIIFYYALMYFFIIAFSMFLVIFSKAHDNGIPLKEMKKEISIGQALCFLLLFFICIGITDNYYESYQKQDKASIFLGGNAMVDAMKQKPYFWEKAKLEIESYHERFGTKGIDKIAFRIGREFRQRHLYEYTYKASAESVYDFMMADIDMMRHFYSTNPQKCVDIINNVPLSENDIFSLPVDIQQKYIKIAEDLFSSALYKPIQRDFSQTSQKEISNKIIKSLLMAYPDGFDTIRKILLDKNASLKDVCFANISLLFSIAKTNSKKEAGEIFIKMVYINQKNLQSQ